MKKSTRLLAAACSLRRFRKDQIAGDVYIHTAQITRHLYLLAINTGLNVMPFRRGLLS